MACSLKLRGQNWSASAPSSLKGGEAGSRSKTGVAWRLEPFKVVIDAMLIEDATTPRKHPLLPGLRSAGGYGVFGKGFCPIVAPLLTGHPGVSRMEHP